VLPDTVQAPVPFVGVYVTAPVPAPPVVESVVVPVYPTVVEAALSTREFWALRVIVNVPLMNLVPLKS